MSHNRGFAILCTHEHQHRMKRAEERKCADKKVKAEKDKSADGAGGAPSGVIVLNESDAPSLLHALVVLLKPPTVSATELQAQIQVVSLD